MLGKLQKENRAIYVYKYPVKTHCWWVVWHSYQPINCVISSLHEVQSDISNYDEHYQHFTFTFFLHKLVISIETQIKWRKSQPHH